jgi:hypothetical protein
MVDIPELRRLHERATPGPWKPLDTVVIVTTENGVIYERIETTRTDDRNMIVALRNALPAILARLEQAERLYRATKALHFTEVNKACGSFRFDIPAGEYGYIDLPEALRAWEAKS